MPEGKIDQLAYYCEHPELFEPIKRGMSLQDEEWVEDEVIGSCLLWLPGQMASHGKNRARLQFNYSLGIELELLSYLNGAHWHQLRPAVSATHLSHIGIHMEPEDFAYVLQTMELPPRNTVQEMLTLQHTNEYVTSRNRHYYYQILDTVAALGHYTKRIFRIDEENYPAAEAHFASRIASIEADSER